MGNIFLQLPELAHVAGMDNDHVEITQPLTSIMKRHRLLSLLLLLSLAGPAASVWADGRWRDLPPDERRQMRQQMREHWQQEREIRRDEGGPRRWNEVPPEDRRRMREEIREQRGANPEREPRPERRWQRD